MTFIELVVSIAVLTVVSGAIGAATTAGFSSLGTGGARDRLAGAHDFSTFEQQLSADVARAGCVRGAGATIYPSGSCATWAVGRSATCGAVILCTGWPDVADGRCHTAVYAKVGNVVTRQEYSGPALANTHNVTSNAGTATAAFATLALIDGRTWVKTVTVSITSTGVRAGALAATLVARPLPGLPGAASVATSC